MNSPAVNKSIRKAFEAVLLSHFAGEMPLLLPNMGAAPPANQKHIRFTFHPTDQRPRTMGPNPRVQQDGFSKFGIFVPEGQGQDEADIIAQRVLDAFPLDADLTRDGFTAQITRQNPGEGNAAPPWYYLPVDIYWNIWRAT